MLTSRLPILTAGGLPKHGLVCYHDLYDPTSTNLIIPSTYNAAYPLQLGSVAGSDTNDPAWATGGKGLSFVTDDYCLTGSLAGVALVGPWAAVLAGKFTGTNAGGSYWIMDPAADETTFCSMRVGVAGEGKIGARIQASGDGVASAQLDVPTDGYIAVVAACSNGVITLSRLDTGALAATGQRAPTGTPRIGLGGTGGVSKANSATLVSHLLYNRTLSPAEIQRAYRYLKALWASRGVTIL